MAPADLDEVLAIENDAFPSAWSRGSYERELRNDSSFYFAARHGPQLVGYAGMWVIFEEAHITTIAVHPSYRRRGLARRLLLLLMEMARQRQSCRLTLEVRQNNAPALALYRQLGFEEKGVLPHYYGDTGEDGVVMWKAL
jgi:ribosomal-protein-alanine N-acetyltransferase